MLSKRSIRQDYTKQITISLIALVAIFSVIFYAYFYYSIYGNIKATLHKEAQKILENPISYLAGQVFYIQGINPMKNETLKVSILEQKITQSYTQKENQASSVYYHLFVPYDEGGIQISLDITQSDEFLKMVLRGICLVDFFALIVIWLFALAFSNILYKPIWKFSQSLLKIKEQDLELLEDKELPYEFQPLLSAINDLLQRVKNHLLYQKQFFIGIAHELKTPLAVAKTKSEVTLIKEREKGIYIEALKENIKSIDEMNVIIKTLLDLGRQESAQFEKSIHTNIMKILGEVAENFKILAKKEQKNFIYKLEPKELLIHIKPTLLTQIIQNFLQNALKFTPQDKTIMLESKILKDNIFQVVVIDEGCGIDSDLEDIYAPFRRAGNKSGAGLGLFLAKNAANALGGKISLKNRLDNKGSIATFELKFNREEQ